MNGAEAAQCRQAILQRCAAGDPAAAQRLLGQFIMKVAQERRVPLSTSHVTLAAIFAPPNLTPDRLEGLWQWLRALLPELPDPLRRSLAADLEPVALSPDLPLHLYMDVFAASRLRERPDAVADVFKRIAGSSSFAEGHALFQRAMMIVEQRLVGEKARAFRAAHDCFDALLAQAWKEGAPKPQGPPPAGASAPERIDRCAIVTDSLSDARGHGPTRMALSYAALVRATGATVRLFETADRRLAADQDRFNPNPAGFSAFDPAFLPQSDYWRPSLDKPRLEVLRDSVEAIHAFAPDVILRIGAPRCFAAAQAQWRAPVYSIATSSYWPGEFGVSSILIKGVDRVLQGFDGVEGLARRLVEHRHFIPAPRIGPVQRPLAAPFVESGAPAEKAILGTLGWNAAHAVDDAFAAMMRRVLVARPEFVWCIVARSMPPPAAEMKAAGYAVFHTPPVARINRAMAALYALLAPPAMTGGAGGQMRAVAHGCPVVAAAAPLSDAVRLFLGDTAFDGLEAYERALLGLTADPTARDALLSRQRALLAQARADARIDAPHALAAPGRTFLRELSAAGV